MKFLGTPRTVRILAALGLCCCTALLASTSRAEDEFDVTVTKGHVTVKAKGKWHINKDYPWRFEITKEKKLDKSAFTISEESASVDAPAGEGKVRGGVCNGDQCMRIEKTVVVP